eukprot:jgi/Botrbrau1/21967/Bobra.0249s0090.1
MHDAHVFHPPEPDTSKFHPIYMTLGLTGILMYVPSDPHKKHASDAGYCQKWVHSGGHRPRTGVPDTKTAFNPSLKGGWRLSKRSLHRLVKRQEIKSEGLYQADWWHLVTKSPIDCLLPHPCCK